MVLQLSGVTLIVTHFYVKKLNLDAILEHEETPPSNIYSKKKQGVN